MTARAKADGAEAGGRPILVQFDDNDLLPLLLGDYDRHLARIEQLLDVSLSSRGNSVAVAGPPDAAEIARDALNALYRRLRDGLAVDGAEVDAAVRLAAGAQTDGEDVDADSGEAVIPTPRRRITPAPRLGCRQRRPCSSAIRPRTWPAPGPPAAAWWCTATATTTASMRTPSARTA